jgi:vacuolar-type H+-ATPase subunit H
MNDYSLTIIFGILAALIAIYSRPKTDRRGLKQAQKRADGIADTHASAATEVAQSDFDQAETKANVEALRIDKSDLKEISAMVDHEYGSD